MSETITIIRRVAEAADEDLGADFRAGLSVGIAELSVWLPAFLTAYAERRASGLWPASLAEPLD